MFYRARIAGPLQPIVPDVVLSWSTKMQLRIVGLALLILMAPIVGYLVVVLAMVKPSMMVSGPPQVAQVTSVTSAPPPSTLVFATTTGSDQSSARLCLWSVRQSHHTSPPRRYTQLLRRYRCISE